MAVTLTRTLIMDGQLGLRACPDKGLAAHRGALLPNTHVSGLCRAGHSDSLQSTENRKASAAAAGSLPLPLPTSAAALLCWTACRTPAGSGSAAAEASSCCKLPSSSFGSRSEAPPSSWPPTNTCMMAAQPQRHTRLASGKKRKHGLRKTVGLCWRVKGGRAGERGGLHPAIRLLAWRFSRGAQARAKAPCRSSAAANSMAPVCPGRALHLRHCRLSRELLDTVECLQVL
jgi:hypothetical protein